MTRVLMITNRFIFGGIEKLLLDVFENKNNPEIKYDLLTLTSEKDEELIELIKQYDVSYNSLSLDKYNMLKRQFYHYKALYDIIKKGRYDVVHINITSYARVLDMITAKKAGAKKRIIHSHSAAERDPLHRKLIRPIRKLYDYSATDFFACSDEAAKHLFSKKTYKEGNYTVIKNGICVDRYVFSEADRQEVRRELAFHSGGLLIGHVGRLTEAKNHSFILDVFNEIRKLRPDSKLLLVGEGELRGAIENKVAELGMNDSVILYGSSSNTARLLSAMDVFLFPSIWEGLGISVVEAQCNGLPCYVSERVPEAAIITSNVYQYSIGAGAENWAKSIIGRTTERVDERNKITEAGYDIKSTVAAVERYYLTAK